ncbi:hypothetical protein [Arthrobacter oryzae]|uniref:hypothetical protein n=1 Tax=Arthrobacter oryzae TaxID=409290 RepID=UPI00273C5435|nr:hypothetical protein [Arthrobacter oryzae]WLQ07597.1 hypothetical protein Q8Z05_05440 [Arthrobacter oryzae]
MKGPGQNYYLWYSLETKKISVISWDLNLAITGNATASPDEQVSIGGGGGGGGMQRPPGADDDGGAPPSGAAPPDAAAGLDAGADAGGRGGNELKERFLASTAFQSVYNTAYAELYEQLYSSGTAAGLLDRLAAVVPASDGLTEVELAEQTATFRKFIEERTEALKNQV